MAIVREETPKTYQAFVELVNKLRGKNGSPMWYRGVGRSSYKLLPSLYRHKAKDVGELGLLERKLMTRFRQRSIPFHSRRIEDDWDALFFMQHYGVPTRLLDWSENPFVALYFAVMSAPFIARKGVLTYKTDAAVWILNPASWNRQSLSHQTFDGGILTPGDEELKSYKPSMAFNTMNNYPVGLYGAHNSPRIVAQRGTFVLFGQDITAMEATYEKAKFKGCNSHFSMQQSADITELAQFECGS